MESARESLQARLELIPPQSRLLLASFVVAAVLLIATALALIDAGPRGDVTNFYDQALLFKEGLLPYTDFEFEFPPLALAFFSIPLIFTTDLTVYCWIFAAMSAILMAVASYCIMRMAPSERLAYLAAALFTILILFYITDSVKKFDGIVMSLTVMSLFFFSKEKWWAAYALMAVAAMTKLYPCLFIPLMIGYNLFQSKEGVSAVKEGLLSCIAVFLMVFVPLWISGVSFAESFSFLGFHSDRGFHVESLVATVLEAMSLFGLIEIGIVEAHNTDDICGPLATALLPVWNYVIIAFLLSALVLCAFLMRRSAVKTISDLSLAMLFVCIVFMLANKVFSTQYMMWIFPLISMMFFTSELGGRMRWLAVSAVVMQISCIIFLQSEVASPAFVTACALRDIILIVFAVTAFRTLMSKAGCRLLIRRV